MSDRAFERAVGDWLEDGSDRTPRSAIDAVLLAVRTTPQDRVPWLPARRHRATPAYPRLAAAAIAVVALLGGGTIWYVGQTTRSSPPTATSAMPTVASPSPAQPSPSHTRTPIPATPPTTTPSPSQVVPPSPEVALGWPTTARNATGLYSWDGNRCAGKTCIYGFMHNGYGTGDVAITIDALSEKPVGSGTTAVTVAGHDATYRRVVAPEPSFALIGIPGLEEWIIDIDGVAVRIRLYAQPGTSVADLDDAHAIVSSLRYEATGGSAPGFRLTFRLTNDQWDSG